MISGNKKILVSKEWDGVTIEYSLYPKDLDSTGINFKELVSLLNSTRRISKDLYEKIIESSEIVTGGGG